MQHLNGIERARHALENGMRVPAAALTQVVAESWSRCRELGLDPRGRPRGEVIPFAEVNQKRDAIAALRKLALAEMGLLHGQIAGSNFMIALGDADGVVLDTISDQIFADSAAGRSIIPGSLWSEGFYGTNALGLAAMKKEPVAIYGREHYFACHSHLSCMAAPILNSRGEVLGLLDASCSNEARQQHTHALVRMAAAQIENGLIFHERVGSFIFAFHPRVEYLDTLSAGLIAVSPDGEVLSLNQPGTTLLAGLPASTGSRFDALFEAKFGPATDDLLRGEVIRVRDRAGSAVFMVCRQIGQSAMKATAPRAEPPSISAATQAVDFVCEDAALKHAIADLDSALALRMPVHIVGETGTGKELMARHVHKSSGRKGAFVAINCGAIPESLFIAEIFGHERGAFTDARRDGAPGLARTADGGTLFLDEVADIPLTAQTALLRFLDSMEIRAVGANASQKVDVQIVSASNRDLQDMIASRTFRADLFYRLNALTITLPALRRRSDFGLIVRHLVNKTAPGVTVTNAAMAKLSRRRWPGNVRELHSVLQRALIHRSADYLNEDAFGNDGVLAVTDSCEACCGLPLREQRCRDIRQTYREMDRNVSRTARKLGLSRTTVYKHVG